MQKIILDTNTLLIPEIFKVDIFVELHRIADFRYELCVLPQTVVELNKIKATANVKNRIAANIGLSLIKAKDLKILDKKEGYTDDILVELGKEGFIVVTQDKELKRRLKAVDAEYITLRQKKHLIFVNKKD